MVGPPPPVILVLVLVITVTLETVADKFPPWGSVFALVVLELDLGGLVEVGGEADVVVPPVLERGGSDSLVAEDGDEVIVVVGEDAVVTVKLRGNPVPVTDVTGGLEAVVSTGGVGEGPLEEEEVGTSLVGVLKEELVAKDELMVMKLEMVEVEERTSGDDVAAEDVKLRNGVGKWRSIIHEVLTMTKS